ncbi:MAG: response regulator transcription factor [Ruminococcus sp.]|nr:response regulator transcription factor [Ruminococcus sp.]MDE7226358.1 response regulator transcription factor [Ruminococcus sp.]
MKTIAIIDDDIYINAMLSELLEKNNYRTLNAYSGTEALYMLSENKPDLILLDLMLPGLSGEKVLPKIKDIPVIVMSAKADVNSKVKLLLDGASDYITKPFNTAELLARIAVQLRNTYIANSKTLEFLDIILNMETHEVTVKNNPVRLTKTEFAILKLLMQNPSQVITKSVILDRISLDTPDCVESSLKVHISNIRRKFRKYSETDYIEAVWGIGFKMSEKS